jgi:hypothetical protein
MPQENQQPMDSLNPLALVEMLPRLVDAAPRLVARGRALTLSFLIEIGAVPFHVTLTQGRVHIERGPLLMRPWSFAIRGPEQAWSGFWQHQPQPWFHDIFALTKSGAFKIEGDLYPLMSNLLYFKELLAMPRHAGAAS